MSTIIGQVLGTDSFYTESYIKDTITFVKSLVFVNSTEAKSYNDYLAKQIPGYTAPSNKKDWRYYKHIVGVPHEADLPVSVVSVDSGEVIQITRASLIVHRKTKEALLKFGQYYDQVVAKYPQQELYIKSCCNDFVYTDLEEIIDLDNFTIVSFNGAYIEENEDDLVKTLQLRIDNYKSVWLLPYYGLLDSLFLASQYHIFYNYLVTSLLAIRLENDKTIRAHSYHIRMYLASHHGIDKYIMFLSKKQQLFLYKNMLYLDNHSGKEMVFRDLIDVLYTDRNISVVNYVYNQQDTLDSERRVNYTYNQKLLNRKPLLYRDFDYSLEDLGKKETPLAPGNKREHELNSVHMDTRNRYAVMTSLLTKDLETILLDETDSVKYKLLDTLTDYWAYLCKTNRLSFLADITDPVTNVTTRLRATDLFKLYVICLHAREGIVLDEFPEYRIKRVYRDTLPTSEQISKLFYDPRIEYRFELDDIMSHIPVYGYLYSSFQFSEFVMSIYKLNIGLWILHSNYGDMDTYGQMEAALSAMHKTELYEYNDETVSEFLSRVGVSDPREYEKEVLTGYVFGILDTAFDGKLSFLNKLKKLQEALTHVFSNFNSYTVQVMNNYYNSGDILAGIPSTGYGTIYTFKSGLDVEMGTSIEINSLAGDPRSYTRYDEEVYLGVDVVDQVKLKQTVDLNILVGIYAEPTEQSEITLPGYTVEIQDILNISSYLSEDSAYMIEGLCEVDFSSPYVQPSNEVMTFLANNF